MNVFNASDKTSNQPDLDDAGFKRYFIVAIVEGVSKHNGNLSKLVDRLLLILNILSILLHLISSVETKCSVIQVMLENIVACGANI